MVNAVAFNEDLNVAVGPSIRWPCSPTTIDSNTEKRKPTIALLTLFMRAQAAHKSLLVRTTISGAACGPWQNTKPPIMPKMLNDTTTKDMANKQFHPVEQ
jgi:hypothetical protein